MSSALGCSEDVVEDTPTTTSDVTRLCRSVSAGAAWWNYYFPTKTGVFHVEFNATPSAYNIDAVVGLSSGTASSWSNLAAIVRFAPNGVIDVRKGSTYAADVSWSYYPGQKYNFRIDVDITRHVYSVYLLTEGRVLTTLATNYPFRTEQASITSIGALASYLEPSRPGSLNICDIRVVQDDSYGGNCLTSTAGGTFKNIRLVQTQGVLMSHFDATPSTANMDGVIGFGWGPVDSYNDFAASVRFATNGMIEARDGDTYRADQPYAYRPGTKYRFRTIIDVPSKTYSIMVAQDPSYEYVEIARAYKFRTQQLSIPALDTVATIVASSTGRVDACGLANTTWDGLQFARRGKATVVPLHNNNLAITTETETLITDRTGNTLYRGAPIGLVAEDANNNLFIARKESGYLVLSSYTATLTPRWTRQHVIDGDPRAITTWADGRIVVNVDNTLLVELNPDGSLLSTTNIAQFSPSAVALGPWGWGLARITPDGMTVESFSTTYQLLWQRFWPGSFGVENFVMHGNGVAVSGQFYSTVDLGSGAWEPYSNPEATRNTFLLSLTGNGVTRFAHRLWTAYSTGLATDHNQYIAVATQDWTQTPYWAFTVYDSAGNALYGMGGGNAEGTIGFAGGIAVGYDGRAFVNLAPKWTASGLEPSWPHLFAIDTR